MNAHLVNLTAGQLTQLEALLADTTPGGGCYRPPVVTDVDVLKDLEDVSLVRWTQDCGYEITDTGRAVVVDDAMDMAASEAFVRCASRHELREAIGNLKAVFNDLTDPRLRERTLVDIEACQDRLDDLVEGRSESTGRHHLVPVDDRPTEVLPRVQQQPEPEGFAPSSGTLPGLPVVEPVGEPADGIPADPDPDATVRLIAAIRATPGPEELAEVTEATTAGWAALEADLADGRSWLRPYRAVVLAVVVSVVVTWGIAWLVLG